MPAIVSTCAGFTRAPDPLEAVLDPRWPGGGGVVVVLEERIQRTARMETRRRIATCGMLRAEVVSGVDILVMG